MNTTWILRVVLASILVYASAIALENVAAWFARPRRWVWLGALIVSLGLPALAAFAPASMPVFGVEPVSNEMVTVPAFTTTAEVTAPPVSLSASAPPVPSSVRAVVLPTATQLWIAASTTLLLIALSAAARLAYLRRRAGRTTVDGVDVLVTTDLGPLVTGLLSPAILLPSWVVNADSSERKLILAHEQQHIEGGDHWLIPLGALLVIAMPWNPGVWMIYTRFRLAIETDCDARVIDAGADRHAYGDTLIRVAGNAGGHNVLSPAWSNRARQLEHRVRAITAGVPQRRLLRSVLLSLAAVLMIAVAGDAATPDRPGLVVSVTSSAPDESGLVVSAVPSTSARRGFGDGPEPERVPPTGALGDTTLVGYTSVPASTVPPTVPSAATLANAIVTEVRADESGGVRVNGLTRRDIKARVHLTGEGARLVVLSGQVLNAEGDSVADVMTPAEFGVVGTGKFQIDAAALDSGEDLEIIVLRLDEQDRVTQLTYGNGASVRVPVQGTPTLTGLPQIRASLARISAARDSARRNPSPPPPQSDLEPGQIRVTSESGRPMLVLIRMLGHITIGGRSFSSMQARDIGVEMMTPFTFQVAPNQDFSFSLSAPDSTQKFSVEAQGGAGGYAFGYMGSNYRGSTAICWRVGKVASIGPGRWGQGAEEACARMGVK